MEDVGQGTCFGAGSVAGAVIGTFLTTILLLAVAALLYKQWRRHKGKHLVLVTDPEIVEDAYAFDNPCFKDATPAGVRTMDQTLSTPADSLAKDSVRWSTPWMSLVSVSTNRHDKRRTLDDSCVGPKATRVSTVSLRSHDFTGLGFNVCGNMREGIFVKDLLHRGPASESGRIHPGDRIASVKISFRNMVYEDALTILSYASPYDVELEVESGGTGSKPTTLLKKTVSPSSSRICHPLYRSQSIPELSQPHKSSTAKRLFIADPNESIGSNYSTMNSTLKSSKLAPSNQTLERRQEEAKNNHHHKIGIKVLPALDGAVHRIENQNEHNTNLERRHSKQRSDSRILMEKPHPGVNRIISSTPDAPPDAKVCQEAYQQRENRQKPSKSSRRSTEVAEPKDVDVTDQGGVKVAEETIDIPSEVPAEVHNAAMAARRNRKTSSELLAASKCAVINSKEQDGLKSPQKNKRKAPAPPKLNNAEADSPTAKVTPSTRVHESEKDDTIDVITDYTESLNEYVSKVREMTDNSLPADTHRQRSDIGQTAGNRKNSESDTDSEMHNSFTTIELNPADITIHRTPVPQANDEDDDDDIYRKAASLGDLSKYENKSTTPLERAQSLDMTDTISSKKRKAPLPPEDINESTEDLTKLDQMDTFDKRKLKKSSEWGTLEDVIWGKGDAEEKKKPRARKKSNGTLERSKSAVEIKLRDGAAEKAEDSETSIELYNLPLSKRLTQEFIHAERMFNPDEDNSLARIVNDGMVVKSPTVDEVELDFRQAKPLSDDDDDYYGDGDISRKSSTREHGDEFNKALRYFELHSEKFPTNTDHFKVNIHSENKNINDASLYAGKKVVEETMTKMTVNRECPGCAMSGKHGNHCKHSENTGQSEKDAGRHQNFEIHKRPNRNQDPDNVGNQETSENTQPKFELAKSTSDLSNNFRRIASNKEKTLYQDSKDDSSLEECDERERLQTVSPTSDVRETVYVEKSVPKFTTFEVKERHDINKGQHDPQSRRADPVSSTPDNEHEPERARIQMRFNSEMFNEAGHADDTAPSDSVSTFRARRTVFEPKEQGRNSPKSKLVESTIETHFAKPVIEMSNSRNFSDDVDDVGEDEEYEFGPGITVSSKNMSSPKDDRHNISNVSVSSGENSEDSGLVRELIDYNPRDESRPPLPNTPVPNALQKMTYITEIKLAANKEGAQEAENERIIAATESNGDTKKVDDHEVAVTSNGKPAPSKKPPVPPRRSDMIKASKDNQEKQMVYVSEYKSNALRNSQVTNSNLPEVQRNESEGKKFEHWIYLGDSHKEQNRWGNGSSQPQQVTNIIVSSGDEKSTHS